MCTITDGLSTFYSERYGPARLGTILGGTAVTFAQQDFSPLDALESHRASNCAAYAGVTQTLSASESGAAFAAGTFASTKIAMNSDLSMTLDLTGAAALAVPLWLKLSIPALGA